MDRLFLKRWSARLADDDFARAVAGAYLRFGNAEPALRAMTADLTAPRTPRQSPQKPIRIVWKLYPDSSDTLPPAEDAVALWQDVVQKFRPTKPGHPQNALHGINRPQLLLSMTGSSLAELLAFAKILTVIDDIDGISINPTPPMPDRMQWRLPFTISTLADDALADALQAMRHGNRPHWPFRFTRASRSADRPQILVLRGNLVDSLAAALRTQLRMRVSLVIVNGLGSESPASTDALLRALTVHLSANAVAVVECGQSSRDLGKLADRVNSLAFSLCHNMPLEAALREAFGRSAVLISDPGLLIDSQMQGQIAQLQRQVRDLPTSTPIILSTQSAERLTRSLRLPARLEIMPKRAKPPIPAMSSGPQVALAVVAAGELHGAIAEAATDYQYDQESEEATAATELAQAIRSKLAERAMQKSGVRYVQQRSFRADAERRAGLAAPEELRHGYVVGEPVRLRVRIGDPGDTQWVSSDTPFRVDLLPPAVTGHRLQVMFHEPTQFKEPLLSEVFLPPEGPSSEAEFVFLPNRIGRFEGRITIVHRGRILQTTLLVTQVVANRSSLPTGAASGIMLRDETRVRRDWSALDKRRRFELAIVCNHDSAQVPRITALSGKMAWGRDLRGLDQTIGELGELLGNVANNTIDYAQELDKGETPNLLKNLARHGTALYSFLIVDKGLNGGAGGLDLRDDSITHIQIVSARREAIVPIEFIYDYGAPAKDAVVCPQHRRALTEGQCPKDCPGSNDPRHNVCPMGFWGVRKVIERHQFDPDLKLPENSELVVLSEVNALRNRIGIRNDALVAYSTRVKAAQVAPLLKTLKKNIAGSVSEVKSWIAWAQKVKAIAPELLIVFPHNDGVGVDMELEIGDDLFSTLSLIPTRKSIGANASELTTGDVYVRRADAAAPLVFLLGCDTASTAEQFSTHAGYFRQAGAAIVVCTVASVIGEHAVKVGTVIATKILAAATADHADEEMGHSNESFHFGEVLRDAKRQALLEKLPMALCVVAFGDADWRL